MKNNYNSRNHNNKTISEMLGIDWPMFVMYTKQMSGNHW